MPYLNWERTTDMETMIDLISSITQESLERQSREDEDDRMIRRRYRGNLSIGGVADRIKIKDVNWPEPGKTPRSTLRRKAPSAIWVAADRMAFIARTHRIPLTEKPIFVRNKQGHLEPGTQIGRVLLSSAKLCKVITTYRQHRLIRKYLLQPSALHPSRALDQAQPWTLGSNLSRPRKQTAHRVTEADGLLTHKLDPSTREWTCHAYQDDEAYYLTRDGHSHQVWRGCKDCERHMRHTPIVFSVHQLWMWILDEQTIITAFPEQLCIDRHDSSGVHEAIRHRLWKLQDFQKVNTVFDMALIILTETTQALLHTSPKARVLASSSVTRLLTSRKAGPPEVLNTECDWHLLKGDHSNSESRCCNHTCLDLKLSGSDIQQKKQCNASYEKFWAWSEKFAYLSNDGSELSPSQFLVAFSASSERILTRNMRNLISELDTVLKLVNEQLEVVESFKKRAEELIRTRGRLQKQRETSSDHLEDSFEFSTSASRLITRVRRHINDLEAMLKSANEVTLSVGFKFFENGLS